MQEIIKRVKEIQASVEEIQYKIDNFEVDVDEYEDPYREMLDESYEDFMDMYSPSHTLECVDPTAYRCGLLDYVDALEIEYPSEWDDEIDELNSEAIDMLEDKISDLEYEINCLDSNSEDEEDEIIELKENIKICEDLLSEF